MTALILRHTRHEPTNIVFVLDRSVLLSSWSYSSQEMPVLDCVRKPRQQLLLFDVMI